MVLQICRLQSQTQIIEPAKKASPVRRFAIGGHILEQKHIREDARSAQNLVSYS